MATHSNILPGIIPSTEKPGGLSPWGHKKLETIDHLHTFILELEICNFKLFFFFHIGVESIVVNTPVWYVEKFLREQILRVLITRRKTFFFFNFHVFFLFLLFYLYEMMNVNWTCFYNHFTIYLNQTITLCDLDSHVCQLFLNKTEENKKKNRQKNFKKKGGVGISQESTSRNTKMNCIALSQEPRVFGRPEEEFRPQGICENSKPGAFPF